MVYCTVALVALLFIEKEVRVKSREGYIGGHHIEIVWGLFKGNKGNTPFGAGE